MEQRTFDTPLLITTSILLFAGFVFFGSAALGILNVSESKFFNIISSQITAVVLGIFALIITYKLPHDIYWKKSSWIYGTTLFATLLAGLPGIGMFHNGARRWLDLGPLSVQPSEFLKFGFIAAVVAMCLSLKDKLSSTAYGIGSLVLLSVLPVLVMKLQPDYTTLALILLGGFAAWFASGVPLKQVFVLAAIFVTLFTVSIAFIPYMQERVKSFTNKTDDYHGASWQLNQSLIAFGAGGLSGRGLGQSIQKYSYLPEPIGDAVIAVIGEEVGFLGIVLLALLYVIYGYRGLRIAAHAEGYGARMLATGITTLICSQALINIAAYSDAFVLVGVPLPFVSHGGSAMIVNLALTGILLNISKTSRRPIILS